MVKDPRAGRVKTRLGRDIGMTNAAWWYRHQTRRLLHALRDPRWTILLSVAPDRTYQTSRSWPKDLPRIPQGRGDIGQRMARSLARTKGPTVLIGSDIPGITPHHIADAFAKLGAHNTVIGPAQDGGFWLIGLHRPKAQPTTLFQNTRWSHPETLNDTWPSLPKPVAKISTLTDIDTVADLKPSGLSPF